MKLATLKNNRRDGQLVVVSSDLSSFADAASIAPTLQQALDCWSSTMPKLQDLYNELENSKVGEKFHEESCSSPLPRAYQWVDGSAYINHVELVRRARGVEVPDSFYHDPLMYQGGSDSFLSPHDPIPLKNPDWGCDMEAEVAVIVDDVPMGVSPANAGNHIKLIMLCNDITLRNLIPAELEKGFGFLQSKPPSAFSPLAVTPDELGEAWKNSLVHLPLNVDYNGKPFGRAFAHRDATFSLAELVAHAAATRPLCAGSIIGSGTVSNKGFDGKHGLPVDSGGAGYSCIAEMRMIETIETGKAKTPFMSVGDKIRIEMFDAREQSIFGAIDQTVLTV